ncbi:cytochrome P450 [Polyangium aurulentum]|uniref:cytochrome P450 n=1 Tax=Polyangium aurulentum TaxID=2567896 RepID=UPI0010AEB80E|nr:cytochrome P450 [Polyangium aurulentum]UQA56522.1 cytochrome P450 [Polyangium aurulentum]
MSATIPGPRGLPLVGALPAMLREGVFEYVERCWRSYGDMFQIPTTGRSRMVFISHPDALERVLANTDLYLKDKNYDPVRPLLGDGLVTSSGDAWRAQRKLIQPVFHRNMLRGYVPTMIRCVEEMLARWEAKRVAGQFVDLYAEMLRLTHHIVGMTLFGLDISDSAEEAAGAVMDSLQLAGQRVNRGALAMPLFIPTPANLRFQRAVRTLDRLVFALIDEARRASPSDGQPTTLLRLLVEARDESGRAMTDRQLRDELITQYVAGQETTGLSLTWGLMLLSGREEVLAQMRSESAGIGGPGTSVDELDGLTYTRMVVDEILRLKPPVWALTRMAAQDDALCGRPIEAGTTVMFGIYFAHRHPDFWEAPEEFRPERFTPERVKARHHYAYLPFSAGPRTCVGRRFALYEMMIVLSLIARRYRIEVLPGQDIGMKVAATCHPDRPVWARLWERGA